MCIEVQSKSIQQSQQCTHLRFPIWEKWGRSFAWIWCRSCNNEKVERNCRRQYLSSRIDPSQSTLLPSLRRTQSWSRIQQFGISHHLSLPSGCQRIPKTIPTSTRPSRIRHQVEHVNVRRRWRSWPPDPPQLKLWSWRWTKSKPPWHVCQILLQHSHPERIWLLRLIYSPFWIISY